MRITTAFDNNISFSPLGDNDIKLLEKQKNRLQEQIKSINESKMSEKIKKERIEQLQEQIQQIEIQIQQKQTEKLNKKNNNKQATKNQSQTTTKYNDDNLKRMSDLVQVSSTYSKAKIMSNVKNTLANRGKILKKEIETDEARSLSGCKAVYKREKLNKIESKEQMLNQKIVEATKTVQRKIKTISEKEYSDNESESEDLKHDIEIARDNEGKIKCTNFDSKI